MGSIDTRKRKNIPKSTLNKNYDNLNFYTLIIKKISDKFSYLNPFKLSNDVKSVFLKSVNADLLPYGDIRVFFDNINDRMEAKGVKNLKNVFGEEAILEETKFSIFKIVIHSIPLYIKEEDFKEYFDKQAIGYKEIKIKPLKNNENYGTCFVSLTSKQTFDEFIKKGQLNISNRRFKISRYVNRNVVQCYKCQKYGHTANICFNKEVKCRFCAKNHESKNCDQKNNLKCANCNLNHKSSAYNCKVRQNFIIKKNKWLITEKQDYKTLNLEKTVIQEAKKKYSTIVKKPEPKKEVKKVNEKDIKPIQKKQKDNKNSKVIKKPVKIKKDKDWEKIIEEKINKIFNEKLEKILDQIFQKYMKTIDFSNLKQSC